MASKQQQVSEIEQRLENMNSEHNQKQEQFMQKILHVSGKLAEYESLNKNLEK